MASSRNASPLPLRVLVAALDAPVPALSGLFSKAPRPIGIQRVAPSACVDHAERLTPAAVVLDGRIPGAMQILQELTTLAPATAVLFVAESFSVVMTAMTAGASDWLINTAAPDETRLRLDLLLDRAGRTPRTTRVIGPLRLDREARSLASCDREVLLTPIELKLFERLLMKPGCPVSRAELQRSVWLQDELERHPTNVAVVYVSYLRKKLAKLGGACVIRTVPNAGYALDVTRPSAVRSSRARNGSK
jgi:DNA-binding response OmpR family regulator